MTLENIYRDINSKISDVDLDRQQLYHNDIVKAINDAIREIRIEYVKNDRAEDFAVSETLTPTTVDNDYPFLYSTSLTNAVTHAVPISIAVLNSVVSRSNETIPDSVDTFTTGDKKIKGDYLYTAVADGFDVNAFDLVFEVKQVKNYAVNNELKFFVGDVAYNISDGTYWRTTSEYTNNQNETISESGAFEQLYWKRVGDAYLKAIPVEMERIHEQKLHRDLFEYYPFSIQESTFYAKVPSLSYYVSYVPEWTNITDLSTELDIPDQMIPNVKIRALQFLSSKLNVDIQLENISHSKKND